MIRLKKYGAPNNAEHDGVIVIIKDKIMRVPGIFLNFTQYTG